MIVRAHFESGRVVLDEPLTCAEGTKLFIHVAPTSEQLRLSRERLMKHAGVDKSPDITASTTYERDQADPDE